MWVRFVQNSKSILKNLLKDEDGQATIEYILLLSFSFVTVIAFARAFSAALDKGILRLGGQLEKDLRTGRAPLNVYIN